MHCPTAVGGIGSSNSQAGIAHICLSCNGHAVTSKRVLYAHTAGRSNKEGTEHVKCVQGYRVHLEIWKVLLEDCRWVGMSGPLDPTNFNPSRSTMLSVTFHCF